MDCDPVGVSNRWIMMGGCREWTVLRKGCDWWGVRVGLSYLDASHHLLYD